MATPILATVTSLQMIFASEDHEAIFHVEHGRFIRFFVAFWFFFVAQ
jgi:hypothetical protein